MNRPESAKPPVFRSLIKRKLHRAIDFCAIYLYHKMAESLIITTDSPSNGVCLIRPMERKGITDKKKGNRNASHLIP